MILRSASLLIVVFYCAGVAAVTNAGSFGMGSKAGPYAQMRVINDPPSKGPGTFHGYADSSIIRDGDVPGRFWLAYSWLSVVPGTSPSGASVLMAVVASHLAASADGGRTFSFVRELYLAQPAADPEGSGEKGILSSETVSLASMRSGERQVWFGAHLCYFLRPMQGYNPKYGTGWTVRIGAADSPEALGDDAAIRDEAVLGVSTTASAYKPDVAVDRLAGLPIQKCAMLNNPALFVNNGTLYLIVECLAFNGTKAAHDKTTMRVFGTTPGGSPKSWKWRHVGILADHSLAGELGADTILQPEVTLASDGSMLLIVTPAVVDESLQVKTRGTGCVAIELDSIDPPKIRRDSSGKAVIRARVSGDEYCACAYDNASATGIITHVQRQGRLYTMHPTGVAP